LNSDQLTQKHALEKNAHILKNHLQTKLLSPIFQEFTRLSNYVRLNWYNAQTLSESFQIKEIGAVVRVLRPIVIAFTLLMCSAGSLMASMQYLHFFKDYPLATGVTQAIANVSTCF
jgi:hypothetical protein